MSLKPMMIALTIHLLAGWAFAQTQFQCESDSLSGTAQISYIEGQRGATAQKMVHLLTTGSTSEQLRVAVQNCEILKANLVAANVFQWSHEYCSGDQSLRYLQIGFALSDSKTVADPTSPTVFFQPEGVFNGKKTDSKFTQVVSEFDEECHWRK